jgi:glycerol kinase
MLPRYTDKPGVEFFRMRTGLPLSSYFSSLKIRWILDNVPDARRLAETGDALFGNIDTFLVWHLTGGPHGGLHVTDVTNASRTQLMNLQSLDWDPDLLAAFDIPRAMLPAIRSSSERYGEAMPEAIRGVPIAGILGDQQAALVGQTCFRPGEAKNTYGTGCFMLMNTGETAVQSRFGLLTTVAYRIGAARPCYALEGSVAVTGALVQWLRDNLKMIESSADVEALARSVPDNGGAYCVPAFSGLYAPHWNDRARGVIAGLTRFVTRGHLARAVLEATAFQTWEVLQAMEKDSGVSLEALRVDGGMTDNALLMQFQADIVNRTVVRPAVKETTALGAAFAAGVAVGVFRDADDLRARWVESHRWTPAMDSADRDRLVREWSKAVSRSLNWVDVEGSL